jgi:hypothetical protein
MQPVAQLGDDYHPQCMTCDVESLLFATNKSRQLQCKHKDMALRSRMLHNINHHREV